MKDERSGLTPEEELKKEEEFLQAAFKIIMPAGDARNNAAASLDALLDGDDEKAEALLKEARNNILEAHKVQTELIQAEAAREMSTGTSTKVPMLFIHAQDTLMTIMSEVKLTESMERMYRTLRDSN